MATTHHPEEAPTLQARGTARAYAVPAARRHPWRQVLQTIGKHLLVGGVGLVFVFPVIWMFLASTRTDAEIFQWPPEIIPHHWTWSNYSDAFSFGNPGCTLLTCNFARYTRNTVIIAGFNVIGTLISCSLSAYAFARVNWRGRGFVFLIVLSTMLLPYPVTLIPVYIIFKNLNMIGTSGILFGYGPLIVPAFFGNAFFIFLLRQFFMTIPRELDEAALIDGAGHLGIFTRVILPLSRPALAVVALLTFLNNWTDLFGPMIYLNDTSLYTLSLGLQEFRGAHTFHWSLLMAASVLFILPIVILFVIAQRTFIQGITMTGLKG